MRSISLPTLKSSTILSLLLGLSSLACDHNPCVNDGNIEDDADEDGVPDCLEAAGIDADGDREADFVTNTSPQRKDIFIKIDWLACAEEFCLDRPAVRPRQEALDQVVEAFANAPIQNLDSSTGIDLHIELGEAVPYQAQCGCDCVKELFEERRVLNAAERASDIADKLFPAKSKMVHYFLYVDEIYSESTLYGQACPGAFGISRFTTDVNLEARILMHELGHLLGLQHGGDEPTNFKPNYVSAMNYSFARASSMPFKLDFSREELFALDENNLNEALGIQFPAGTGTGLFTRFYDPSGAFQTVPVEGPINWNSLSPSDEVVTTGIDINNDAWCVTPGIDGILQSRASGTDHYRATGGAGATARMVLNDPGSVVALVDDYKATVGTTVSIRPGPNRILDTPVGPLDILQNIDIARAPGFECASSVAGGSDDILSATSAEIENRVYSGYNDWANIDLLRLRGRMGGLSLELPEISGAPGPDDLPAAVVERWQTSDIRVEVEPSYSAIDGRVTYSVLVANAGPDRALRPSMAFKLPGTASNAMCSSAPGVECALLHSGAGTFLGVEVLLPDMGMGVSTSFTISADVDSSQCSVPGAYDFAVKTFHQNQEENYTNDNYSLAFPDSDGDGQIDVCSWPLGQIAVYGFDSLSFGSSSVVSSSVPSGVPVVADRSSTTLNINANAIVGDVLANGNVFLGNFAQVQGSLVAGGTLTQQSGSTIAGTTQTSTAPSPELPEVNLAVTWIATGLPTQYVYSSQTATLSPGRFGNVVAYGNSDVYVSAGDYYFDQLDLESNARFHVDSTAGPVRIFVKNQLTLRGNWTSSEPDGSEVLVVYTGTSDLHVTTPTAATLVALNAKVIVAQAVNSQGLAGAVMGRYVEIQGNALVVHAPFRGTWPWAN